MNKNSASKKQAADAEPIPVKEFKKIPGQADCPSEDFKDTDHVIGRIEALATGFGFSKVEPSLFEFTDVTHKFHDRAGQPLSFSHESAGEVSLRTSGLPAVLRMYAESLDPEQSNFHKWYYLTPVVTVHENPYQLSSTMEYGFEVLGDESAIYDAQMLALGWKLYGELGEEFIQLEIGSRGCDQCWPEFKETLSRSLSDSKYSLCKDCASSVDENPERVLLCDQEECQAIASDAPTFIDFLDQDCSSHLTMVLESLDEMGVPYVLMPTLEGHQHSKRTVFSFKFNHPQDSFILGSGSRHDKLFAHHDHDLHPALGLRGDLSQLVRAWRLSGKTPEPRRRADIVLLPLGDMAAKRSLSMFSTFWDEGLSIINLLGENSLKVRLQQAADLKIPVALVVGQKEALDDTVILRDVKSGMQEVFPAERILVEVRKRLGD